MSLVRTFRALADPTRLALLTALAQRPHSVGELMQVVHASQPKVSRHLAYLRRSALVSPRRRGRFVLYQLADHLDPMEVRLIGDLAARRMP